MKAKALHNFTNSVIGGINKGDIITAPQSYIELLESRGLVEVIEEAKPQPVKETKKKVKK